MSLHSYFIKIHYMKKIDYITLDLQIQNLWAEKQPIEW